MLEVETKASDLTLHDQNGVMRSLADYRGSKVVSCFSSHNSSAQMIGGLS